MKSSQLFPATLALLFLAAPAFAAQPGTENLQQVMQSKLGDAQSLLGSVAKGDFPTMEKTARHMVDLANLTSWYSSQTPREQVLIGNFRWQAEALLKAAEKKNLDGASLAYTQLTLACFACHKTLRESRVADLPIPAKRSTAQK